MRRRITSRQAGFTLLEMMICLVLLGFLGSLMMTSHQLVLGAWRRLDDRGEVDRSVEAAQNLLRSRIERLYPAVRNEEDGSHVYAVDGSPRSLLFVAPLLERTGTTALGQYLLQVRDDTLRLSASLDDSSPGDDAIVMDGIADVEFGYFGRDDASSASFWHDRWQQRDTLPELIRVRLTRRAMDARPWPDLVIAPMVTAGARCRFIQADTRCHAP